MVTIVLMEMEVTQQ